MDILYENTRLPAIVYPWTGDAHLLRATLAAWRWLDEQHLQPYGVASGEEFASGIGPFRKTETCDVTSMLMSASWLYRVQGDGDWGDRMERAFFNAGAAPWPAISRPCATTSRPTASAPIPCLRHNRRSGRQRHSLQQTGLSPGAVLRRRRQPHHSQLHHPHVDGDSRQRAGGDPVRALHGLRAGGRPRAGEDHARPPTTRLAKRSACRWNRPNMRHSRFTSAFPAGARMARITREWRQCAVGARDSKGFVRIARTWAKDDLVELTAADEPAGHPRL